MGPRPLEIVLFFQCGDRLQTSEYDVFRRLIWTSKVNPRTEKFKIIQEGQYKKYRVQIVQEGQCKKYRVQIVQEGQCKKYRIQIVQECQYKKYRVQIVQECQ